MAPLLVLLSGAAALVYELVWTRWLTLALGAGARSMAVVVGATMLGLAAGSRLAGAPADRSTRPLRLYAGIELAIALAALAAGALLRGASAFPPAWPPAAAAAAALLVVVLPMALMGATLPCLTAAISRGGGGRTLGRLYAWNTTGAVIGSAAAGFVLVRHLGLRGSTFAAAALNAGGAALALAWDRWKGASSRANRAEPAAEAASPIAGLVLAGAAASGAGSLACEVLFSRLLVHGLSATTHALSIIFTTFIAGLALGAHAVSRLPKETKARTGLLGAALLASAILAMALAPSLAESARLLVYLRGAHNGWGAILAVEAAVSMLMLPVTAAMGLCLPLAAAALRGGKPGESSGRLLFVNTLAGMAGALASAFGLLPWLGLRRALWAVTAAQAVVGALLVQRDREFPAGRRRLGWLAAAVLAVSAGVWASPPALGFPPGFGTLIPHKAINRELEFEVLCYHEGAVATTSVIRERATGARDLVIDGFVAAGEAISADYMALMGSLPMLLHGAPRRALVICFGTGSTARAVAQTQGASIDLVDVNADVFGCAAWFGPANEALLRRASVYVEDGRHFLARGGPEYDVITQEPMPPYFAGVSALYSVEYYELAKRRLAPGGVLVQWLPMHLVAPEGARAAAAAALAVFPETWIALAPVNKTGLIVCSNGPLDAARRRKAERELGVRFVLSPAGVRRYAGGTAPVTDDRPSLEYTGLDRVYGVYGDPVKLLERNLKELLGP